MNTIQLNSMLNDFDCLKGTIIQITAVNTLPQVITNSFPQIFIVNSDPYPNSGKHWVCVIFYSSSKSEYFDSLGKPPDFYGRNLQSFIDRNSRKCTFILKRLQATSSDTCGLYVIFFVLMRLCFHVSLQNLYDMFDRNFEQNDDFVKMYLLRTYSNK